MQINSNDRRQLTRIASEAKTALQATGLTVYADRGYYQSEEIRACELKGIVTYVPKSRTSNSEAAGLFAKKDFIYRKSNDDYVCPAGESLSRRTRTKQGTLVIDRYWSSNCKSCKLKSRCTTGKERRVSRWEHEDVLDRAQQRIDRQPNAMRIRRAIVEHPFGTLKGWMGSTHFLTKSLPRVSTEMSLHVLAYNMKRVINLIGTQKLIEAIQ